MQDTARIDHFRRPETAAVDASSDAVLSIGEVAREFGLTLRALRFYEAKRLITPQRRGPIRVYRRSDCARLTLILTGRRLGFTLAQIRQFLSKSDGKGLQLTRQQCLAQINLLEQQKRGIEIAITELRRIYTSFYRKLLEDAGSGFAASTMTAEPQRFIVSESAFPSAAQDDDKRLLGDA
jgi:DNA-binding transcriptional MerR regulator